MIYEFNMAEATHLQTIPSAHAGTADWCKATSQRSCSDPGLTWSPTLDTLHCNLPQAHSFDGRPSAPIEHPETIAGHAGSRPAT